MKFIQFIFLFLAAEMNLLSQQIVHFTKDTPATIILPDEVSIVYSTAYGSLYVDDALNTGISKIYLGAKTRSLNREYVPKEDKMEDRLDRADYTSKSLSLGISETFFPSYQQTISFSGGEYIIIPASDKRAWQSKDYFTETEEYRYSISIEFPIDANPEKISLLIQKLLNSFMENGYNTTTKISLVEIDTTLMVPALLNGWQVTLLPLDTVLKGLVLDCYSFLNLSDAGLISENDFLGPATFQSKTGDFVKARLYKLSSIQIGNKELFDVDCLFTEEGPTSCIMGIGKQIMDEMGPYEIDRNIKTLEFK